MKTLNNRVTFCAFPNLDLAVHFDGRVTGSITLDGETRLYAAKVDEQELGRHFSYDEAQSAVFNYYRAKLALDFPR